MSVRVMTRVWDLDLPDSQKIVLLALADCANDEGHCWPSMRTLAKKCSKGERTVQGVIIQLVKDGHLTRREIPGKGCNYTVHPRSDSTPAENAPRNDNGTPPQGLRDTPAEAADKPSMNRKEPSDLCALGDELVSYWNERKGLKPARRLSAERRKKLATRRKSFTDDELRQAVRCLGASDWHTGKVKGPDGKTWQADIGWLLKNDENVTKALELPDPGERKTLSAAARLAHLESSARAYRIQGRDSEAEEFEREAAKLRAAA